MNLMRSKKSLAEIRGHMELAEQEDLRSAGGVPIQARDDREDSSR